MKENGSPKSMLQVGSQAFAQTGKPARPEMAKGWAGVEPADPFIILTWSKVRRSIVR